ncbi:mannose-1-phosphate guanylyltransferase [candidate division KSB1 bacterium]
MYGIIMAGGIGKRFWPMSRTTRPKQFLRLFSENSMIRMTYERLLPIMKNEDIFIITNKKQNKLTAAELPEIPKSNIVCEPLGKDTAPCIGLGALFAIEKDPDAVIAVLPADHLIKDETQFRKVLKTAGEFAAAEECLVTIGIEPTRPETGYGYIQIDESSKTSVPEAYNNNGIYKVKAFAEKPNIETAKRFIESGDFLWNSGIFIWKAQTILQYMEEFLPELYDTLNNLRQYINTSSFNSELLRAYKQIKSISIDYGIMEKAHDVFLVRGDFGWSDVGSWEEYYNIKDKDENGNVCSGTCVTVDSNNNLIISDNKLVTAIGMKDMIVVNTKDVMLICPRGDSQKVKTLVDKLTRKQLTKYL